MCLRRTGMLAAVCVLAALQKLPCQAALQEATAAGRTGTRMIISSTMRVVPAPAAPKVWPMTAAITSRARVGTAAPMPLLISAWEACLEQLLGQQLPPRKEAAVGQLPPTRGQEAARQLPHSRREEAMGQLPPRREGATGQLQAHSMMGNLRQSHQEGARRGS